MTETDKQVLGDEGRLLTDTELEGIAGGNPGGKPGRCPGCGRKNFSDLGGGKIKCKECGWEGTRSSISA